MVEKIGHIKNPLTVIAIFAAVAEISGTTVLPFIEPGNQSIYIWFLMLFPVFLVASFFVTLNYNHKVLYAPSDYKDEKNFVDPYGKASPEEQDKKLREEVAEIETSQNEDEGELEGPSINSRPLDSEKIQDEEKISSESNKRRSRQIMAEVTLAEKLAINKLSKEIGINFKTGVRVDLPNANRPAYFDALGLGKNEIHAVEVKLLKARHIDPSRFANVLHQAEQAAEVFSGIDSKRFILHVFAVLDAPDVETKALKRSLYSFAKRFKIRVFFHVTTLSELENEYRYNL